MQATVRRCVVALVALSSLFIFLNIILTRPGPRAGEEEMLTLLADAGKVRRAYQSWQLEHERGGGDGSVQVPLGYAKGLSVEYLAARGMATLDLIGGKLTVEITGLDGGAGDVWLVDNVAGPGRSMRPEPGDEFLFVGSLSGDVQSTALEAEPQDGLFLPDLVVVTRNGEDPMGGPLLFGSPSTFQRLYTRGRIGAESEVETARASHEPVFGPMSFLGAVPAFATVEVVDPDVLIDPLVARGADIFFNETFDGNGRTCATCHPAVNNFTIDPAFISTLRNDDALFVAEFTPALSENFEKPQLMRSRGLILENVDGFDDLENKFVMRGVPHVLALQTSIEGPNIPFDNTLNPDFDIFPPAQRTGWSGDGAPGAGTLREFAVGAVIQHFTKTLGREPDVDFRLPTDAELDALEVFMLSLGRTREINISDSSLPEFVGFRNPVVERGREIFNTLDTQGGTVSAGKCALCHDNAGASLNREFFSAILPGLEGGNANFGTGVNDLPSLPADLIDAANNPRDGGFARVLHDVSNCSPPRGGFGTVTPEGGILPAGLCEEDFNTPPLVEAADSGPFFHNNSVDTLEAAVAFYNDAAFNDSAGGQVLAALDSGGVGIVLQATEVTAVSNMLRVVNALENIRTSLDLEKAALRRHRSTAHRLLDVSLAEMQDAVEVLQQADLHPKAVDKLRESILYNQAAHDALFGFVRDLYIATAIEKKQKARRLLVR